jgi:peptidoglycan/xylan/chitin deacetylase (PgdA/CDA1 family)
MRELILTFHGLGEPPTGISGSERKVWLPVEWLHAVLDALPPQGVRLTFDDSNASDLEHALPALTARKRRAQFFILAGELGADGRLAASDVGRLHEAGMGIGSHGLHHQDWRAVADDELSRQLVSSQRTLASIVGCGIAEAACPFGSYDRRVLRALRSAGYRRVYTSDGAASTTTGWLSSRTTITSDRPLEMWLDLIAAGPSQKLDPVAALKGYVKRFR